jgi:hypothetical protein
MAPIRGLTLWWLGGHMSPNVVLAQETIDRLKGFAEPLVDTFDTVMHRAMDALEAHLSKSVQRGDGIRKLNPENPPNLSYTTVHTIIFNGKRFAPAETYWNHLLLAVIREAAKKFPAKKLDEIIICNHVMGKKENNGYKFIQEAGLSVQGQDANGAWKAIVHIALELKMPIEVEFSWQDNPKAVAPGERAKFQF